jgi:hypothetical protein
LKRLFPALLVAGGFLILWLGLLGDLTASVDAALSIPTHHKIGSQERSVCLVGVSSQPTMTYGTVQAGVDDAQEKDIVTVMGRCMGAGMAPIALINKSLTLRGEGEAILEGEGVRRLLSITGEIDVTVENLELRGGKAIGNGGALYLTTATLTLQNSVVVSNSASNMGGGIYAQESILTIDNTTIEGNIAEFGGGGLFSQKSSLALQGGSTIVENMALSGMGGGLYATQGDGVTLNGIIVASNQIIGHGHGGGVYLDVPQVTLSDNLFSENIAIEGSGGALYLKAQEATFSGNLINDNQSTSDGGGFWLEVGTLTLNNNTLTSNQSSEGRGGRCISRATPLPAGT